MDFIIDLHPVLQAFIATLFTYGVTALGASLVFFFKSVSRNLIDIMLGFSAGVMIAASFWSLLEPAIELSEALGKTAWIDAALGFALGGVFVMLSDIFLSNAKKFKKTDDKVKKSIMLTAAVTLHNIPEGMAVGVAFGSVAVGITPITGAIMLALGIGLQNFPEGVCVSMPLYLSGKSKFKSFLIGQASGLVEPIAGVLGALFAMTVREALPLTLSFSGGAMIAVVCSELIPEAFEGNKRLAQVGVLSGFIVMMTLDVALG